MRDLKVDELDHVYGAGSSGRKGCGPSGGGGSKSRKKKSSKRKCKSRSRRKYC